MLLASSRWAGLALALLALVPATPAQAQSQGFAINRFDPAERGSDWFAADSLDLRGHGRLALGVTGDFGHKPLVLYDRDGEELSAIIENQLFVHFGGSLVLWERLRLGVSMPLLAYQSGEGGTVTLYGDVRQSHTRREAENRVAKLDGVGRVVNNINVLPLSSFDDSIRAR